MSIATSLEFDAGKYANASIYARDVWSYASALKALLKAVWYRSLSRIKK
ncbi:MAG: hypothetical protein H7Z11_01500 [Verrucomicrobia bacterium]|nr:hypothetical protein [Leptolyngbya sp. ES-bin-22]